MGRLENIMKKKIRRIRSYPNGIFIKISGDAKTPHNSNESFLKLNLGTHDEGIVGRGRETILT